jgi:ATP-dependent RNA helicase DDX56/DBP9
LPESSRKPEDVGFVGLNVPRLNKRTYVKRRKVVRRGWKVDPLKMFNARGKGKK